MIEVWKDVPGYEGSYRISNLGNVISYPKNFIRKDGKPMNLQERTLRGSINHYGYKKVLLKGGPKGEKLFSVHRLVALAFLPNPEGKPQVNHIDGVKTNNLLSNLEWCTNSENQLHAYATGLSVKNPDPTVYRNKNCLTVDQMLSIRERLSNGEMGRALASEYSVSESTISMIKSKKRWIHD